MRHTLKRLLAALVLLPLFLGIAGCDDSETRPAPTTPSTTFTLKALDQSEQSRINAVNNLFKDLESITKSDDSEVARETEWLYQRAVVCKLVNKKVEEQEQIVIETLSSPPAETPSVGILILSQKDMKNAQKIWGSSISDNLVGDFLIPTISNV